MMVRRWSSRVAIAGFALCLVLNGVAKAQSVPGTVDPAGSLPRSSPEAQGVSSAAVRAFVEAANNRINTLHSFMLLRHGHVVAEGWWKPEAADKPHVMHSLSKSFTSTAVGLVIEEGKLSLDDRVL
jgi:CubicO group peptidase (beta-lactamase class C family)